MFVITFVYIFHIFRILSVNYTFTIPKCICLDDSDGNPVILQDPAFTYICGNVVSLANSSKVIESVY